jgi:hypothetical protein
VAWIILGILVQLTFATMWGFVYGDVLPRTFPKRCSPRSDDAGPDALEDQQTEEQYGSNTKELHKRYQVKDNVFLDLDPGLWY